MGDAGQASLADERDAQVYTVIGHEGIVVAELKGARPNLATWQEQKSVSRIRDLADRLSNRWPLLVGVNAWNLW